MQIVLESGVIYSGIVVTLIISLALDSWFQYILVDSVSAVTFTVHAEFLIFIHLRWPPLLSARTSRFR